MSEESYLEPCPECKEHTCVVHTDTSRYGVNLECWSCGFFSVCIEGKMTSDEIITLKEKHSEMVE